MHQNRQSAPRAISSSIKKCTYLNKLTATKKAQFYKELRLYYEKNNLFFKLKNRNDVNQKAFLYL